MDRIRALNRYQKAILLILAAMTLVFGIIYIRAASQHGYAYRDEILLPSYENGSTVYSGKINGAQCSFTVTADKTVTFRCINRTYGPYTALEDPTAVPTEYAQYPNCTGVVLYENGKQIFRGAALTDPIYGFHLADTNGEMLWSIISTMSDGTRVDEHGTVIDPWEPGVHTILELMGQPELTAKGEWGFFFLGLFLCAVTVISILFADELFRLSLVFTLRDWEQAEPSDFELAGRYIGWTLLPILILWVYCSGLH